MLNTYGRWLIDFLRLGRPLFLVGGFVLHSLGATIALYQGATLHWPALLWGQIAVTATQLMTHYSNDYYDLAADRANLTPTRWSGGSRVLVEGGVQPAVARQTALLLGLVTLGAAGMLAFVWQRGPLTLPLLLLALLLAWGYSAPPMQLHSRGLGELVGAFLIPGLTVLVGYYLQAGRLTLLPLLAALPLCLFQFVMLLCIEFPDAAGDAAAGKHTLVIRLGAARAARLAQGVLIAALLLPPILYAAGLPLRVAVLLFLGSAPAILWLYWRLHTGRWAEPRWWPWLGFISITLVMGPAMVLWVGFLSLL